MIFRRTVKVPFGREIFLSALGGWEGGLATTTAIIAGLFISTQDRELVLTTAIISLLVQAFNGAIGRFSGERTSDEIEQSQHKIGYKQPIIDALSQMLTHITSSLIVIAPIIFIPSVTRALALSIGLCLLWLFVIGTVKAIIVKGEILRDAVELVILGSLVITVGIVAGLLLT